MSELKSVGYLFTRLDWIDNSVCSSDMFAQQIVAYFLLGISEIYVQ